MSNAEWLKRFDAAMMPTYAPPVVLARGEGCLVWDTDDNEYLDLIAGIAVSALGHAHPAIVSAVARQVGALAHTSNLFAHDGEIVLAERLLSLLGTEGRVFFVNSGTEANEVALKLVRKHAGPERTRFVAMEKGFHGRTMGALALTGKASIREPFAPFGLDTTFVPFGDAGALRAAVDENTAAVFVEPMLGEGGVVPAPDRFLRDARAICDATGAALVIDEIQAAIGRTGAWFGFQREGITPDVVTVAKGLGGGIPIGACIGIGAFGEAFAKSDHGSTFGGNPVACAAALAVLDTIEHEGLLAHVSDVGAHFAAGLGAVRHPLCGGVRGRGLWLGLELTDAVAPAVEAASREAGFLVNAVQPDAIRIAPPLILTAAQADRYVAALPSILDAAASTTANGSA